MTFAQFIQEATLELRCSYIELDKKLGEIPGTAKSWINGELPDNPKKTILAIQYLKFKWFFDTEPDIRNIKRSQKKLDIIRRKLELYKSEKLEQEKIEALKPTVEINGKTFKVWPGFSQDL